MAVLANGALIAQDYSICAQVIGSSGLSVSIPGQEWSYTVGEAVIGLIADPNLNMQMTQGFHQPELCNSVSTAVPDLAQWDIRIYPNPSAGLVWLDFQPVSHNGLLLSVYNVVGQSIIESQLQYTAGGVVLDCSNWQAGLYFLHFTDPATQAQSSFRLLRL